MYEKNINLFCYFKYIYILIYNINSKVYLEFILDILNKRKNNKFNFKYLGDF